MMQFNTLNASLAATIVAQNRDNIIKHSIKALTLVSCKPMQPYCKHYQLQLEFRSLNVVNNAESVNAHALNLRILSLKWHYLEHEHTAEG